MTRNRSFVIVGLILLGCFAGNLQADAADTPPAWDGVWLARSLRIGKNSELSAVWHSTLTIRGNNFMLSHFYGISQDVTGSFVIHRSAGANAIDLQTSAIDLSSVYTGTRYPPCTLPGTYETKDGVVTFCFSTGPHASRLKTLDPTDADNIYFSIQRADAGFKAFPQKVALAVTDPQGKPAADADVFNFMEMLPSPPGNGQWIYSHRSTTGVDGTVDISYDKLNPVGARDARRKWIAFALESPASLQSGRASITLQPQCDVVGQIMSLELEAAKQPVKWTFSYLYQDGERLAGSATAPGSFEFLAPPGAYTVEAYGQYLPSRYVDIVVPAGQPRMVLPPIELHASKFVGLIGQPAPELQGVEAWKDAPVKLADLRGKYVLLHFWGLWCGPCVQEMPEIMDLYKKYKDKIAIVSVHVDLDGDVSTVRAFGRRLAETRAAQWKDIPFPVALASGKLNEDGSHNGPAGQYDVHSYPTTILIDKNGNVVGAFYPSDDAVAKLLGDQP